MGPALSVIEGDITQLAVGAIVNAANETLLGGGGVDGAIHRAAGPGLLAECKTLGGCDVGQAKATGGYHLPADFVIHTVGPRWRGGDRGEDAALSRCYTRAIAEAHDLDLTSIAFPAISTGVFGFPPDRAAPIAVRAVRSIVMETSLKTVIFCCFGAESAALHRAALAAD